MAVNSYQLADFLKINDKLMETIWVTLKYILANETDLLINKHIDTIILCCFYSVTKIFKNPIKF